MHPAPSAPSPIATAITAATSTATITEHSSPGLYLLFDSLCNTKKSRHYNYLSLRCNFKYNRFETRSNYQPIVFSACFNVR